MSETAAVTQGEYIEFKKRMEDHNDRTNARLKNLETETKAIHELAASMAKMSTNMENMLDQMTKIDNRLESLEHRDTGASEVGKIELRLSTVSERQEKNEGRITALESQDGEKWRKAVWCVISAVIGLIVGFVATRLGVS